jgi:hypothetical protein
LTRKAAENMDQMMELVLENRISTVFEVVDIVEI